MPDVTKPFEDKPGAILNRIDGSSLTVKYRGESTDAIARATPEALEQGRQNQVEFGLNKAGTNLDKAVATGVISKNERAQLLLGDGRASLGMERQAINFGGERSVQDQQPTPAAVSPRVSSGGTSATRATVDAAPRPRPTPAVGPRVAARETSGDSIKAVPIVAAVKREPIAKAAPSQKALGSGTTPKQLGAANSPKMLAEGARTLSLEAGGVRGSFSPLDLATLPGSGAAKLLAAGAGVLGLKAATGVAMKALGSAAQKVLKTSTSKALPAAAMNTVDAAAVRVVPAAKALTTTAQKALPAGRTVKAAKAAAGTFGKKAPKVKK